MFNQQADPVAPGVVTPPDFEDGKMEKQVELKVVETMEPEKEKLWDLELNEDGQLYFLKEKKREEVFLQRCFPWSHPSDFISLRNSKGEEVHLVDSVNKLPDRLLGIMNQALVEQGFCFRITEIDSIDEDFELRSWQVKTEQGERRFQTAQDEWPIPLSDGGFLVKDLFGDLYRVPPDDELPLQSRKKLSFYID